MASDKANKKQNTKKIRFQGVVHARGHLAWCENANAAGPLTAVHLVAGILAVDHLVTAAVVGDAASVFALELSWFAQGHCREAQAGDCEQREARKKTKTKWETRPSDFCL